MLLLHTTWIAEGYGGWQRLAETYTEQFVVLTMEYRPPGRVTVAGFVALASASDQEDDGDLVDNIHHAQLIQSLWCAGIEVSIKDEAVYETMDASLENLYLHDSARHS